MQSSASSTRQSASERVSEPFTRDSTLPLDPSGNLESHDTSEAFFCSLAGCHSSEPSRDFSQSSSADIGCPSIEHLDEDFQGRLRLSQIVESTRQRPARPCIVDHHRSRTGGNPSKVLVVDPKVALENRGRPEKPARKRSRTNYLDDPLQRLSLSSCLSTGSQVSIPQSNCQLNLTPLRTLAVLAGGAG
jgi:hypothetical protein